MIIAVDTETTGADLRHGAAPFIVTVCDEDGEQQWWEWPVDPLTRRPQVPEEDVDELADLLSPHNSETTGVVFHSAKFDVAALSVLRPELGENWQWDITEDTLYCAHLLASNQPKNLTDLAVRWLGRNIEPLELRMKATVMECRRLAKANYPDWRLAKEGLPEMPSAKESVWKYDLWLPAALKLAGEDVDPTVVTEYANEDSAVTMLLWRTMRAEIKRRGLEAIYLERLKLLPVVHEMEARGVTLSKVRLDELRTEYRAESEAAGERCLKLAASYTADCPTCKGTGYCDEPNLNDPCPAEGCVDGQAPYELEMPKGAGPNNSLRRLIFDVMGLKPMRGSKSKTAAPTLDKTAMSHYLSTLPPRSKALAFIQTLADKRNRDTAVAYLDSYERFWREGSGCKVLHPNLNVTGTDTLRFSSNHPNEQNISKKPGFNLRYCFGPAPGREWWSLDATNIELRLPAYEAGEEAFIALFEQPDEPPYFGSNHLLIAHLLFPKEFEGCLRRGVSFKDKVADGGYKETLYGRVKNGNFAVQYGAVDRNDGMGTADRAYGVPGAQARIKARFREQEALNQRCIAFANRHGYVETMPDRTVDPKRGYPLWCARGEYGRVKPTIPLNYHVQGTAMWWMAKAMARCHAKLAEWREQGFDAYMPLQVHDELVFDLPKRGDPTKDTGKFRTSNLWRIKVLQKLMEQGGGDVGVPTPVSVEYHLDNYSTGVTI